MEATRAVLDRRPFLNALAFSPALRAPRLLAYFILDAVRASAFVDTQAYPSLAEPRGVWAVLYAAAACLRRQVLALDELELHDMDAPQPMAKPQLRGVIRLLCNVVAHSAGAPKGWWPGAAASAAASAPPSAFWAEASAEFSGLLAELHARHCRRPLGAESVWAVDVSGDEQLLHGLLDAAPFTVPFQSRVAVFRSRCEEVRVEAQAMPAIRVRVARSNLFPSTLEAISALPPGALLRRLSVEFQDDFGMVEAGIDAGGLFKDLWTETSNTIFDPAYGLFRLTPQGELYPNPSSSLAVGEDEDTAVFYFLGRFLGKALLEGVTVNPQFAQFFLAKMLGKPTHLHYLSSLDNTLYANLMFVRTYDGDVENDLCLTMVLPTDDELLTSAAAASGPDGTTGGVAEIPLVPGGGSIAVTKQNRVQYVFQVADMRLNRTIAKQTAAFQRGMFEVIPRHWLSIFSEPELQILISGSAAGIDIGDLRRNTRTAGWGWGNRAVDWLWEVLEEASDKDRAAFLRFVTSCERPPPLGFKDLAPPLTVQHIDDTSRLPTASTCFNTLKLPGYTSKAVLKAKLLMAIHAGAGFDLS